MNLENQVSSLELSQKLKELGAPQDSLFYINRQTSDIYDRHSKELLGKSVYNETAWFSAYTVAELGEMLPKKYKQLKHYYDDIGNKWVSRFDYGISPTGKHMEYAKTEADCRAKMLIYLIENGLLDPKTLKIRH